ncbi:MAG TPA: hypothetical protein PLC04_04895 [Candidatus Kapabacteria bacterium]|jgi:soluble cytochrome b562|nr:hypothetical protein [Candidatus Kapabacteria bacterium]HOV92400.1 hypothetical protein [Candidatus Kapabacteria bacterium]
MEFPDKEQVNEQSKTDEPKAKNEIQSFFDSYKKKIDNIQRIQPKWQNLRSARQKLLSLQKELNTPPEFIPRGVLENIQRMIADALSAITQSQIAERENYEMECSDNYLQLKSFFENIIQTLESSEDLTKSRQQLIDAQRIISTKTLKRSQQEELYQMIRSGFDILLTKQEKEKEKFNQEANQNYEKIAPLVENAINIANSTDSFKEAREVLTAAQNSVRDVLLTKEQRDELFGKLRIVFNEINKKNDEEREEFAKISEENFNQLREKIEQEAAKLSNNPHFKSIREDLLTIQSELRVMKLKLEHRNKLYTMLKDTFKVLDEKRAEYFEKRDAAKKSGSSLIKNLEEKLSILNSTIESDKAELAELQDQLNNPEIENKDELIQKNEILLSKINEKEKRIKETQSRLKGLEKKEEK